MTSIDLQKPGLKSGANDAASETNASIHSGDLLAWLHEKGRQEKWAISEDEIFLDPKPFASGAAGEVYKCKWRGKLLSVPLFV